MNLRPLGDRLVVERLEVVTEKGGIHIPDVSQERPYEGVVLARGEGRLLENGIVVPMKVQVGDKVLFGRHGGTDVEIEGKKYLILREDEVMGVLLEKTTVKIPITAEPGPQSPPERS